MHRLLERLPDIDPDDRTERGRAWLGRHAATLPEAAREAMLDTVVAVLSRPDWADLFAPGSLAEVPIAAVVGGQVVTGTIDRLVVGSDRVRVIDYKTSRRPPAGLDQVPVGVLRQMGAYAAALEATFPGRGVEVALLYTAASRLIPVPADVLAAHKPGLRGIE